ncbi:MAG: hypothetical protein ACK54M_17590, partial [Pseudanabaena sp.]
YAISSVRVKLASFIIEKLKALLIKAFDFLDLREGLLSKPSLKSRKSKAFISKAFNFSIIKLASLTRTDDIAY